MGLLSERWFGVDPFDPDNSRAARTDLTPKSKESMHRRYSERHAISNPISYAKFFSRSHDAVIRVYDEAGNVIETHEHKGDFREW
jgi:hypothetical protein